MPRPTSFWGVEMPPETTLCEICEERPGTPQVCTTDGARHRHGMIHAFTRDMHLTWTCYRCRQLDEAAARKACPHCGLVNVRGRGSKVCPSCGGAVS